MIYNISLDFCKNSFFLVTIEIIIILNKSSQQWQYLEKKKYKVRILTRWEKTIKHETTDTSGESNNYTWDLSMTWAASNLIGNSAPSSDWKDSMGDSVPDVKITERRLSFISLNATAGCKQYMFKLYFQLVVKFLPLRSALPTHPEESASGSCGGKKR